MAAVLWRITVNRKGKKKVPPIIGVPKRQIVTNLSLAVIGNAQLYERYNEGASARLRR